VGVVAASMTEEEAAPAPEGFAPLYYLGLAFRIARWDDISIRRASRDPRATYYGLFIWTVAALAILLATAVPQTLRSIGNRPTPVLIVSIFFGLIFGLLFMCMITFMQLGLCHLIAKWFLGASGTFMRVMRPLLLGWFVNVLALLPVVGIWAAGIAWTAVLMLVFEEVDGIGRLQAFAISAGINVCFIALQFAMVPRPA
jgi:hypothetical protein